MFVLLLLEAIPADDTLGAPLAVRVGVTVGLVMGRDWLGLGTALDVWVGVALAVRVPA